MTINVTLPDDSTYKVPIYDKTKESIKGLLEMKPPCVLSNPEGASSEKTVTGGNSYLPMVPKKTVAKPEVKAGSTRPAVPPKPVPSPVVRHKPGLEFQGPEGVNATLNGIIDVTGPFKNHVRPEVTFGTNVFGIYKRNINPKTRNCCSSHKAFTLDVGAGFRAYNDLEIKAHGDKSETIVAYTNDFNPEVYAEASARLFSGATDRDGNSSFTASAVGKFTGGHSKTIKKDFQAGTAENLSTPYGYAFTGIKAVFKPNKAINTSLTLGGEYSSKNGYATGKAESEVGKWVPAVEGKIEVDKYENKGRISLGVKATSERVQMTISATLNTLKHKR